LDCLDAKRIYSAHFKVIQRYGGSDGIISPDVVDNLAASVETTAQYSPQPLDDIERACLACYLIVKGHPFQDGNKRTAYATLINCLKTLGYRYSGRPKDLAVLIVEMAASPPLRKHQEFMTLAYHVKGRAQKV
jgi:death-on-curing protein